MGFPFDFHFGPVALNAHLVFEVFAYILGFQYFLYLRRKSKDAISLEQRMWVVAAGAAGALIGSRTIGYFSHPVTASSMMDLWLGWLKAKSILGGLLGGIIGVEVGKKCMRIRVYTGDLFAYPVILGMMVGRLGCFSQGVFDGTHGIPSDLPWAMDMGDGVRRHPTQLYEIVFLGIVWTVLKRMESRLAPGGRFKVFMIAYLFFRFFIEGLKPGYYFSAGLSAVQLGCVLGFIYYGKDMMNPRRLFKRQERA